MQFLEIVREIEESKIQYLIVGGIAVNLHGIERPTKDLDLVVHLKKRNLVRFIQLMTKLGFVPRVPVNPLDFADPKKRHDWIKNKNMIVFSFYHQKDLMKVIDVFVKHPLPFKALYKRREKVSLGDVTISVMSIPDLVKLKQDANRLQDQSDIQALKKVELLKKGLKNAAKKKKKLLK